MTIIEGIVACVAIIGGTVWLCFCMWHDTKLELADVPHRNRVRKIAEREHDEWVREQKRLEKLANKK